MYVPTAEEAKEMEAKAIAEKKAKAVETKFRNAVQKKFGIKELLNEKQCDMVDNCRYDDEIKFETIAVDGFHVVVKFTPSRWTAQLVQNGSVVATGIAFKTVFGKSNKVKAMKTMVVGGIIESLKRGWIVVPSLGEVPNMY